MQQKQGFMPYLSGVIYATIFGFSFLVTKNALDHIEPMHFLGLRFSIAALLMTLLILTGIFKVNYRGKNLKAIIFLGLFQPVSYFLCETYGVRLVTSSQVGMMIALIPIFVAILSAVFLKEYVNRIQAFCIPLSVGGVIFIVSMSGGSGGESSLLGYLLVLGAVFSGAVFSVTSRKLSSQFSPVELTYIMMWIGAIVFNLLGYFSYQSAGTYAYYLEPLLNTAVIPPILYLAFLSSIVAFGLMNFTLSRLPAARASLFSNLVTIISIIAGVVFRGETFQWFHLVGGILILGGVWGINRFTGEKMVPEETLV